MGSFSYRGHFVDMSIQSILFHYNSLLSSLYYILLYHIYIIISYILDYYYFQYFGLLLLSLFIFIIHYYLHIRVLTANICFQYKMSILSKLLVTGKEIPGLMLGAGRLIGIFLVFLSLSCAYI